MSIYRDNIGDIIQQFNLDRRLGLSSHEAEKRLSEQGRNEIPQAGGRTAGQMFVGQFKNLLVLLLVAAAILSFALASYRDGIVFSIIVILNATIGFYQEWKSENVLAGITKLIVARCIVIRDGKKLEIPVTDLVVGDLVYISDGIGIPADIRLTESTGLVVNEFILTGESVPRNKDASSVVKEDSALADRENCVFMGTTIAEGEATGIVYATGRNTELGRIATSSTKIVPDKAPLQKEIDKMAIQVTVLALILAVVIFVFQVAMHQSITAALVFAIAIAPALVPEGLPAQISIALSNGVQRLAKKKAVVKKLSSVEVLGSATVIASDKTGTITKNEMTISYLYLNGQTYKVTGSGFEPDGKIVDTHLNKITQTNLPDSDFSFIIGHLSSTSKINPPDRFHSTWYPIGDPTECAFSTLAVKAGYTLDNLENEFKREHLFPFDSKRKLISIIRKHEQRKWVFCKGAIESILEIASAYRVQDGIRPLTDEDRNNIKTLAKECAINGLRVIALAYKEVDANKETYSIEETESNLIFAGFAGMIDPPNEGVKEAIKAAFDAHIRVAMITGDNEITALAIAEQVGIVDSDGKLPTVITEKQLKGFSAKELSDVLNSRAVILSRVSTEEKLRIVNVLKNKGDIVAVTGDGVNDTLSLKRADIGVAMGLKGSKIAQEAATMVLLDDNFSTIVTAIGEGRTIYNNILKNVLATLATDFAELTCVLFGFVGAFFALPSVIFPIHIIMIDLLGENIPLLSLCFDPPEKGIMQAKPRQQGKMLTIPKITRMMFSGVLRGAIAIWVFYNIYRLNTGSHIQCEKSMTSTFITVVLTGLVNIFCLRTNGFIFNKSFFSNKYLLYSVLLSVSLLAIIMYVPFLNLFLHTGPLSPSELKFPLIGVFGYLVCYEVTKFFIRQAKLLYNGNESYNTPSIKEKK